MSRSLEKTPDIYEKKCRVCLLEGFLFIFSEKTDLLEAIKLFGGINISQDDVFPKYLCKSCHLLLQSAILFRQKAQETNMKFLKGFEQPLPKDLNLTLLANFKNKPEENELYCEGSNLPENIENTPERNFGKSKDPDVSKNNIKNTPEGYKYGVKRETFTVSRNAKNTPKGNKVIKSESSLVTISVVKDTPGVKAGINSAETNASGKKSTSYSNIIYKDTPGGKAGVISAITNASGKNSTSYSNIIYKCVSCKSEFSKKKDYCCHKKSKHSLLQCPVCKKLVSALRFKKHLENHNTDSCIVCEVCGKLNKKEAMSRHLLLHSNNLPFPCKLCPYRGRYSESLKLHMRIHTGHKPYKCDICQLSFITKSNLNRHSLTHSKLRPHKCVECNKGFGTNRDKLLHIKKEHEGIKEFECELCGNKYAAKRVLRRHEIRVHKRDKMVPGRKPLYLQPEYKN